MGRIIAIDYGKKRTGLAVTDPLRIIASPLETVSTGELENWLRNYIEKEDVEEIVIGYPVTLNNEPSDAVKYIEPFIIRINKLYPGLPVIKIDERFTSKMAFRTMIDGGVKKKDRRDKGMVDRISASILLQTYLEKKAFLNDKETKK